MLEKCPVMVIRRFGVVIVDDELTWGHVRQTVLLQGKVPGAHCCGRFRGRHDQQISQILSTPESLQWWLVEDISYRAIFAKDSEIPRDDFLGNKVLGLKVATKSTLSVVMFAASFFKISALDLVDVRSLPLLMRSFGYPRAAKKISILAASM